MLYYSSHAGGGLTAEDIGALSQPIPDKFWSKIGRRMSSQQGFKPVQLTGTPSQSWFHNDDGAAAAGLPPSAIQRRSFNYEVSPLQILEDR